MIYNMAYFLISKPQFLKMVLKGDKFKPHHFIAGKHTGWLKGCSVTIPSNPV